jgi:molybdate transport system regulatory protein
MRDNDPMGAKTRGRRTLVPDAENSLDLLQLQELENAFRMWAKSSRRADVRLSRSRILLIFLIIRYTGAKLNEVFHLDLARDFDRINHTFRFGKRHGKQEPVYREVQVPEAIAQELRQIMDELARAGGAGSMFQVDPAHVRRKFYEQAETIGLASGMGAPETIRKSRAVELIRSNMPLPVVQKIMGHSTPNLAASYVEFSDSDLDEVARYYSERENMRKTSARNSFFGKISRIEQGDIQALVEITSPGGNTITSIITNNSLARLGLQPGMFITAEVKAPLIQLCTCTSEPKCSAENIFPGTVQQLTGNSTTAEVVVQLDDGTVLCAIISDNMRRQLHLTEKERLWVLFDAFTVILYAD